MKYKNLYIEHDFLLTWNMKSSTIPEEVVLSYEKLKINLIRHTKNKEIILRPIDVKVYLLLLHISGLSAKWISEYYKKVVSESSSFKSREAVNRSLDNLENAGFISSSGKGKEKVYYAEEAIITQAFKSYVGENPTSTYSVSIDSLLLKDILMVIKSISYQAVPKSKSARKNILPNEKDATNMRIMERDKNTERILDTIKRIHLRDGPLQIHRHILTVLFQLESHLSKKHTFEVRSGSDFDKFIDEVKSHSDGSNPYSNKIVETLQILKRHNEIMDENARDAYIKDSKLIFESIPNEVKETLQIKVNALKDQISRYIKEYGFVSSQCRTH